MKGLYRTSHLSKFKDSAEKLKWVCGAPIKNIDLNNLFIAHKPYEDAHSKSEQICAVCYCIVYLLNKKGVCNKFCLPFLYESTYEIQANHFYFVQILTLR